MYRVVPEKTIILTFFVFAKGRRHTTKETKLKEESGELNTLRSELLSLSTTKDKLDRSLLQAIEKVFSFNIVVVCKDITLKRIMSIL